MAILWPRVFPEQDQTPHKQEVSLSDMMADLSSGCEITKGEIGDKTDDDDDSESDKQGQMASTSEGFFKNFSFPL